MANNKIKMADFLLQYFMQLRFNEMPVEVRAKFDDYAKNDDFRGHMKEWKKRLLDANGATKPLPDPNQVGGEYELSEDEWKELFREFQSAFRKMDTNRKNFTSAIDFNVQNQDAIDFLEEYFGFGRMFDKATASAAAETQIQVLLQLLDQKRSILEIQLSEWGLTSGDFSYNDLVKGIKDKKYNTDSDFQSKLKNVAYYITSYTNNPYYKNDDLIQALGNAYDFKDIQEGFDDKAVDPAKLAAFKSEYDILLRRLAHKDKIRNVFPSDKIRSAFDTAKANIAYDDKNSPDYVPPKRKDEITPLQRMSEWADETYADIFEKYTKFKGDRLYFSPNAKNIVAAIHKAKVKPTDGIKGVLDKAGDIEKALLYKSPKATDHFKWFTKTMGELNSTMPKAFEGALRNGRQMHAIIEEMIMIAVRDGKVDEAKTAMEVLSVIKYGYTTSKIMDALGKEKLSIFSDGKLSWNKNEGMKFVTTALDKSIKTAFMGIGYGITMVGNAINLSGSKFKGDRGRMKSKQQDWETQNTSDKTAAINDRNTNNPVAETMRTAEEARRNATGITDATIDMHKRHQTLGKRVEEGRKAQLDTATQVRDNAQTDYNTKEQTRQNYQNTINKYTTDLPRQIQDLANESAQLRADYTAIKNQLSAIPTPYVNSMEELRAQQLQQRYSQLYEMRKQKIEQRHNLIQAYNTGMAPGGEYQTATANIATATSEAANAQNTLNAAEANRTNAENRYNAIHTTNQDRDDKISDFESAQKRIEELNKQIERRNEIVNTWDDKHKDSFKALMAYWDMLETGRNTHMGKMYNWKPIKAGNAQDDFDSNKGRIISDYLSNYEYR